MASHQASMEASGGHLRQVASSRGLARLSELNAHTTVERQSQTSKHQAMGEASQGLLRREVLSEDASSLPKSVVHAARAAAAARAFEAKKHLQGHDSKTY